tara:strand:+ start:374 stop:1084 length:711 start_codon:yes stop_codon:yes gene_type:complete
MTKLERQVEFDVVGNLSSEITVSETLRVVNLFPIGVGLFGGRENDRKISKSERKFIEGLELIQNTGNKSTKQTYILNDKRLKKLKEYFLICVNEYSSRVMGMKAGVDLYITQSWANFTKEGEYHHEHAHSNSIVSGVFYVKSDNETDKIFFHKSGYQQLQPETENFNVYNSSSWWYEAVEGQLFLFPSSLVHSVGIIEKEGHERISLSFNTFPKGNLGKRESLTECILEEKIHNVK